MVAPFATAAFAMAVGDMSSEPVKTEFGWHVIKVEDRRPASPPSYQSVRDGLRTQEAQAALADAMVELHAGAEIERFDNAAAE